MIISVHLNKIKEFKTFFVQYIKIEFRNDTISRIVLILNYCKETLSSTKSVNVLVQDCNMIRVVCVCRLSESWSSWQMRAGRH